MSAQLAFSSDFARDTRDFGGERVQLIDHHVDGVFEFEDFATRIDGDFLRQIAVGDSRRHQRDIAHLISKISGQTVDVIGEVFPGSTHARHFGLSAQFAFGADFFGHARDFGGERVQLIDHHIDGVFEFEYFTFDINGNFLRQVAVGDSGCDERDIAHLRGEVSGQRVDAVGEVFPGSRDVGNLRLSAQLAFASYIARNGCDLLRENRQRARHRVDGVGEGCDFALGIDDELLRQIAVGDSGHDFDDAAYLRC